MSNTIRTGAGGARAEVYRREDGRWAWRLVAPNGHIIATDGGQGYENREDAMAIIERYLRLAPTEAGE